MDIFDSWCTQRMMSYSGTEICLSKIGLYKAVTNWLQYNNTVIGLVEFKY